MNIIRKPFTNDTFIVPGCKYLDESERLARLFGVSEDLLAACKASLRLLEYLAKTSAEINASGDKAYAARWPFTDDVASREIAVLRAAIAAAEGEAQ